MNAQHFLHQGQVKLFVPYGHPAAVCTSLGFWHHQDLSLGGVHVQVSALARPPGWILRQSLYRGALPKNAQVTKKMVKFFKVKGLDLPAEMKVHLKHTLLAHRVLKTFTGCKW